MLYWMKKDNGEVIYADSECQTHKAKMAYAFADHMVLAVMQGQGMGHAMSEAHGQPHEIPNISQYMTMEEIAKKACNLAEVLWAEMKRREFISEFPAPEGWTPLE